MKTTIPTTPLRTLALLVGAFLLLPVSGAATAHAETLVLLDGQTIQTKGPWKLEGRRITYTAENGTFSAIRAKLVDLEKTEALVHKAKQGTEKSAPVAKPVDVGLVVKQGDLRTVTTTTPQPAPESGPAVDEGELGVADWTEDLVAEGTRLTGTLANRTANMHLSLTLEVTLIADNGDELATKKASLSENWIEAGANRTFEVSFPDVFAYSDVAFTIDGQPYQRPTPADDENAETAPSTDASEPPAGG